MKIISLNVEVNKHREAILNFLKKEKADVVCLQELLEDDFEIYKNELGLEGVFKAETYSCYSHNPETHPHYSLPFNKRQGIALFAKNICTSGFSYYVGSEKSIERPPEEYCIIDGTQENAVLAWIDTEDEFGRTFRFGTTHFLVTPHPGDPTPHQLEVLDVFLKQLESLGEFVLVGDMNAPRGKEAFDRIAKKYKDNIPAEYTTSIDQNLHRVKGLQNMVDGLFTTPAYSASDVRLVDGLSDHMAIIGKIEKKS